MEMEIWSPQGRRKSKWAYTVSASEKAEGGCRKGSGR